MPSINWFVLYGSQKVIHRQACVVKKLKLSLEKEHRFNSYSPKEIQDVCKG